MGKENTTLNQNKLRNVKTKLEDLGEIVLVPDFLSLTGSRLYGDDEPDDSDVVIRAERDEDGGLKLHLNKGLMLKIRRALVENLDEPLHFIPSPAGPNWSYLPAMDLKLVPKDDFQPVEVEDSLMKDSHFLKQAATSKKKDRIAAGKFFYPMKPVRAAGVEERMTIDQLVSLFDTEDTVMVEKKYDGVACALMKASGEVTIVSDDGNEVTDRFPELAEEFKNLEVEGSKPSTLTMMAEIEIWRDGEHWKREEVSGYLHSDGEPDEEGVVANVFDILFENGQDLHGMSFRDRRKKLERYDFPQSTWSKPDTSEMFNLSEGIEASSREQIREAAEKLSYVQASEGVVAKEMDSKYYIDNGSHDEWVKFHKNVMFDAIVLETKETAQEGVYNYRYGLQSSNPATPMEFGGEEYEEVGWTFSTDTDVDKGDIIEVEAETIIVSHEDDKVDVTAWVPRFMGRAEKDSPDRVESVIEKADKKGILSLDEDAQKQVFSYPEDGDREYEYVVHLHARGRSTHKDLRIKHNDHLIGWTLMDQEDEEIEDPIKTLGEAEESIQDSENYKINWETGEFDKRETEDGDLRRANIRIAPKQREPVEWSEYEGVSPKGEVGATEDFPGVFLKVDKGKCVYGAIKPYFMEVFLDGDVLNGRYLFRQIGRKDATGEGMGVGNLPQGNGGTDWCYCPECGNKEPHKRGVPCIEKECPECGSEMTGVESARKVYLDEWRERGSTDEMENPGDNWQTLLHELQILGNSAWPKLSEGEEWGDWTEEEVKRYFADVVDALRSVHFPLAPPEEDEEGYDSSYWELYRSAMEFIDSEPPVGDEVEEWDELREEEIKSESFTPPKEVAGEAQRALDARDKYGDRVEGGTRVGWTRANQLADRRSVSLDTIGRMVSFFARHDGNQEVSEDANIPWEDAGYTAWVLWGGDPGREWAEKIWEKTQKQEILPPAEEQEQPRTSFYWIMMDPDDETPYVLSKGAVEDSWMPPKDFSCLPRDIKENVPAKFKYWKMDDREEAREARDKMVDQYELHELGVPGKKSGPSNPVGTTIRPKIRANFPDFFSTLVETNPYKDSALWTYSDVERITGEESILKALKEMDQEDIKEIEGRDWDVPERADALKSDKPKDIVWKFEVQNGFIEPKDLEGCVEQIKDVRLEDEFSQFDGGDTLFYINNPSLPMVDLKHRVKSLEGDVLMVLEDSDQIDSLFEDWTKKALGRDEVLLRNYEVGVKVEPRYKLIRRWWKGQFVVRFGPSTEIYDLVVRNPDGNLIHFEMNGDPRDHAVTAARGSLGQDLWTIDDKTEIPSRTEMNPTKETRAWGEVVEEGSVEILEDSGMIKKYGLESVGPLLLHQEEEGSTIWTAEVSESIKMEFINKEADQQIVGGVVYEPKKYDADGEWATKDTIREAMYYWMEEGMEFSVDHDRIIDANLLECFQAEERTIKGNGVVPSGTWYVAVRIKDNETWERIRDGELKGFSWEGKVLRERGQGIT